MTRFAAVDIGGTFVKYGLVDDGGRVSAAGKEPTDAGGRAALQKQVTDIVRRLAAQAPDIGGIGVSTAGVVDMEHGRIVYANDNMPGYTGTEWQCALEQTFGRPVRVVNDVYAAARAEAWVGAARGAANFVCLTIGTGVGGAAFVNGRLYVGAHRRATSVGYMTSPVPNRRFEQTASMAALVRTVSERTGESLDGKEIFRRARESGGVYEEILMEWFRSLAAGIANVICLFDPELVVIGGGVSREGKTLLERIRRELERVVPDPHVLNGVALCTAACGNHAGLIGAVYDLIRPGVGKARNGG